ncbi:LytR family transcriptional regulator [Alloscardovia theropitheci]|uniref:LytR family transcriptional regulator n=1 Tax=Alloscardovia theropitheci TaxID=2496842 RepID=A0A4R0QXF8_9BIFI|nr:LytR C-terminal domain-containing protein [Alloscardovia theropitheci]TCD54280.1 LytR family transcriptional regulator [Alloscardovia theropitheci]
MADSTVKNEREQRRLYLQARQRVILSVTIGFLAVALLISLPGALGLFSPTHATKEATISTNYGVVTACPAQDTVSLNSSEVTIRVLNGTNKSGLGSAVGEELRNRGFILQSIGDYDSKTVLERTEIRFGKSALTQAYTLAEQFNDAILRMDNRNDKLIDVVIGSSFDNLISKDKTPKAGSKLSGATNCVPLDDMKDLPQAPEHQEVN